MGRGSSILLPDQKRCDAGHIAAAAARHRIAAYFLCDYLGRRRSLNSRVPCRTHRKSGPVERFLPSPMFFSLICRGRVGNGRSWVELENVVCGWGAYAWRLRVCVRANRGGEPRRRGTGVAKNFRFMLGPLGCANLATRVVSIGRDGGSISVAAIWSDVAHHRPSPRRPEGLRRRYPLERDTLTRRLKTTTLAR